MRRLALAVLCVSTLLAVAPVAAAGPTKSIDDTLTGSSQWNAIDFPTSFAISGDVVEDGHPAGTYAGTVLAGTYAPNCASGPYGPNCAPATGSITFALRGGTITTESEPGGLVTRRFTGASEDSYVIELTLDVTSGTHAYAAAQGTLSLVYETTRNNRAPDPTGAPCYVNGIETCPISDTGTLTGTITR